MPQDGPNNKLRQARLHRRWTQEQVAEQIGASPLSVIRWESGKTSPNAYYRQQLCHVFAASLENLGLLEGSEENGDAPAQPAPATSTPPAFPLAAPSLASHVFLGRHEEIATICRSLQQVGRIALVGLPGVGKTTLATYIAHLPEIAARYPDGMLWLGFGPHPQLPTLLSQLALRLGLPASELPRLTELSALAQRVQALVGERRLLVILDDIWQIEDVACFTITGDHTSILLTTRFPAIAHAFALERTVTLAEFDDQQSLELLAQIAPQVVEQYPEHVRDLITSVGGLPLALTLMGWYLQAHHLRGQRRRVQEALTHLRNPAHRLHLTEPLPVVDPHRWPASTASQSLHAVIALSVDHLRASEQALLRTLAFFPPKPNTFSEDAGCALSGLAPEVYLTALDGLVDAGLIESQAPERYAIHQTIVEAMEPPPFAIEALQRLADSFVAVAEGRQDDYAGFDAELPNILVLLDAAFHLYDTTLVRLIQHVAMFLSLRGRHAEAEALLERARRTLQPSDDLVEQIAMRLLLGRTLVGQGRLEEGLAAAEEAGVLAHQAHLAEMEASARQLQGEIQRRLGHPEQAEHAFEAGWLLLQGYPPQHPINYALTASLLQGLGNMASQRGELHQAERWFHHGLVDARQRKSARKESGFLLSLGVMASERGDYATAYQFFLEAKDIAERIQFLDHVMLAYIDLTKAATDLGKLDLAHQWGEAAVALCRKVGNHERLCAALDNLGSVLVEQERYGAAEASIREGLQLAEQMGNVVWQVALMQELGAIYRRQGNSEAEPTLQRGKQLAQEAHLYWNAIDMDLELGEWYVACSDWETASTHFDEAHRAAERSESRVRQGRALFGKARTLWAGGETSLAVQLAQTGQALLEQAQVRQVAEIEYWLAQHQGKKA